MDAGDTFVYGYPTFYDALRDCFKKENAELRYERAEESVKSHLQANPPLELVDQELFTNFMKEMYRSVLQTTQYPADVEEGVDWLWNEWLHGERIRLFDDSLWALKRLKAAGFKLGVVSNWDNTFDATMQRLGVADLFDFKIASVRVGMSKPNPDIFRYALDRTGASPEGSWFLGDQIPVDILPTQQMGFAAMFVDYYAKGDADGAARYTAPSMSVAAEMICSMEKR